MRVSNQRIIRMFAQTSREALSLYEVLRMVWQILPSTLISYILVDIGFREEGRGVRISPRHLIPTVFLPHFKKHA